jgi:ribosomal protein L34E
MVETGKRTMKRKFVKTPSKTTKVYYRDGKQEKNCAITGKKLSGTTSKKASKESKTQKRPSVPFGGILSTKARKQVFTEVGKIKAKIKKIDDVDQKYRKFVKQVLKRAE